MYASKHATILSLDPGTQNFGYSVIQFDSRRRISIKTSGLILSTVTQLKENVLEQVADYSSILEGLIREHSVSLAIAERYMSRRMGGTTIECVNLMLGVTSEVCRNENVRLRLIPSSQWKNDVERQNPGMLPELYALAKASKITPHTLDAVMIGLYGRGKALQKKAYEGLGRSSVIDAILRSSPSKLGERGPKRVKKRRLPRR